MAKVHTSAMHGYYAVRRVVLHAKGAFVVRATLCRAHTSFFKKKNHFYFIIFNTYVYFSISFIFC
jgi:hypothetical protein